MKKIKANTLIRRGVIDRSIAEDRAIKAHEVTVDNKLSVLCDKLVKDAKDASSFILEYSHCCSVGSETEGQYDNILYKMSSLVEVWSLLLKHFSITNDELLEYLSKINTELGTYDKGVVLEWLERKNGESKNCKW